MNLFMALGQFGLSDEIDRPAPDSDRHRLRPVRLPWSRCTDLRALRRREDDLRRHARRGLAQPGRRRPSERRHALARDRVAQRLFYEPAFGREVEWVLLDGDSALLRPRARDLDLPAALDQAGRSDADRRAVWPGSARRNCGRQVAGRRVSDSSIAQRSAPELPARDASRSPSAASWCRRPSRPRRALHAEGVAANVLNDHQR